ncbi:hypothetical protein WICPIJ_009168 [Wickerhamomyces pijperi]|uniref:Mannosyltransferase KTR5 n=1 Tax=Wickerhamomyces pijperi TaxID=599730 RepID=A0A9P8PQ29_WICPI|nr:hypothetical protein WICPIJ_009168 [Wickerhamomyces pijperi]
MAGTFKAKHNSRPIHAIKTLLTQRVKISKYSFPVYSLILLCILPIALSVFTLVKTIIDIQDRADMLDVSTRNVKSAIDQPFYDGCVVPATDSQRANATLVVLARNSELEDVVKSMRNLERHFNQWYQYPWTLLNDDEFSDEFKEAVQQVTNAKVEFGRIPSELWDFPAGLKDKYENVQLQGDRGIMYGSMESYHKMCRFYSGLFYKHPLVRKYEWYWRVEPDVEFFCDITYDPFLEMQKTGKKYGFTIIIKELYETVPNLFRFTKAFLKKESFTPKSAWGLLVDNDKDFMLNIKDKKKYNLHLKNIFDYHGLKSRFKELLSTTKLVSKLKDSKYKINSQDENVIDSLVSRLTERGHLPTLQGESVGSESYNLLHFWSNFEIARVDLWDNPLYEKYFQYLESNGGFYKERWGDAPIHSIAVAFLLNLDELHYFRDIGYKHSTIGHCPSNSPHQLKFPDKSPNYKIKDPKFDSYWNRVDPIKSYGTGCRCRCPPNHREIEDSPSNFYGNWFDMISNVQYERIDVDEVEREATKELMEEGYLKEKKGLFSK